MSAINTGYTNASYSPASVASSPVNFGPGQFKTDAEQADSGQKRLQEALNNEKKPTGFVTPTRGNNLNITV